MPTARDVITRALRLIEVQGDGTDLTAERGVDALASLNELLHYWELEGIKIGHVDFTLDTEVTLQKNHIRALRYNLAVELAPEFDAVVPEYVYIQAAKTLQQLKHEYFVPQRASFDQELLDFQANRGHYDFDTDTT